MIPRTTHIAANTSMAMPNRKGDPLARTGLRAWRFNACHNPEPVKTSAQIATAIQRDIDTTNGENLLFPVYLLS